MKLNIEKLIFSMLRDYGCNETQTSIFKNLKHNNDLVPKFTENLNYLVECCGCYRNASYDIQGVRDNGVDILVRYDNENSEAQYIGIQVKSYHDITGKDWLTKLKAQILEANGTWKLNDLYIAFCTDSHEHKDKLRNASAEINKFAGDNVHIVEPTKALNFINLNSLNILIRVHDFFRNGDPIIIKAQRSLSKFNLLESSVIIDAAVEYHIETQGNFEPERLFASYLPALIQEKYFNVSSDFFSLDEEEQLGYKKFDEKDEGHSWDKLYNSSFFQTSAFEDTIFLPSGCWDLSALILDTKARHNFNSEFLKEYLLNLLLSHELEIAELFLKRVTL